MPSEPLSPATDRTTPANPWQGLVTRASLAAILQHCLLRPSEPVSYRGLMRQLGLSSASVQRDLKDLSREGLLSRAATPKRAREVQYVVRSDDLRWTAMGLYAQASAGPVALLREALRDVPGIEWACVFGSEAAGTATHESDLDVLVVGDSVDQRTLFHRTSDLTLLLGRQVNAIVYSLHDIAVLLASTKTFLRTVLASPRIDVAGHPRPIELLALAAKVPLVPSIKWQSL